LKRILLTLIITLSLSSLVQGQATLRTQLIGPVPCADGQDFVVRLHLDTTRDDIRSFSTQFSWYANLYELRSVAKAPTFTGEFEETSEAAGPIGSVGIAVTSTQLFTGMSAGPVLDFTFRTSTALITEQPFLLPPETDPLFLRTNFLPFTGSANFAATDDVSCSGSINPGDRYGLLRTRISTPVPCDIGQEFEIEILLETNSLPLESVISGFTYDADRFEFVSVRRGPAFTGLLDATGEEVGSRGTFVLLLESDNLPAAFSNGVAVIARFEVQQANLSNAPFTTLPDVLSTETRFFLQDEDFFGSLILSETAVVSCEFVPPAVESTTWSIY
jgi:hypothetical protein